MLALTLSFGFAVLGALVVRTWIRGGAVTGADGFVAVDQLQYIDWLQQSGRHVLIGNLNDLAPVQRVFLHPGALLGGVGARLGLDPAAAFAVWKPISAVAIFAAALAWVRRFLSQNGDRRLALVLALFAISPIAAGASWLGLGDAAVRLQLDFITGELWTATYLWGYPFTAIAVALMPAALLAYERGRDGGPASRKWLAASAVLACTWLQPWQGATLLLALAGAEAWAVAGARRSWRGAAADLVLPAAAAAAPAAYYLILSKTVPAWELVGRANAGGSVPWWVLALVLMPVALPALPGLRAPVPDFGIAVLRAWPVAALVVYLQPAGTFPAHALQGLAFPLAVLGVLSMRRALGDRAVPPAAIATVAAVLLLPGLAARVADIRSAVDRGYQPYVMADGERSALAYLARAPKGGVLASGFAGPLVPAYAGRQTWVGSMSWTPDYDRRRSLADRLLDGKLTPAQAAAVLRRSRARYVLVDCQGRAPADGIFPAGTVAVAGRFGCATVLRVAGAG